MKQTEEQNEKMMSVLTKKPKPYPFWDIFIFDRVRGRIDATKNSIYDHEGMQMTPWLVQKQTELTAYQAKIYSLVTYGFENMAVDIASISQKLELLSKPLSLDELDDANKLRAVKRYTTHKEELLVKIASIKATLEIVEKELEHHLERALQIYLSRVAKYTSGLACKGIIIEQAKTIALRENTVAKENMADTFDLLRKELKKAFEEGSDEKNEMESEKRG